MRKLRTVGVKTLPGLGFSMAMYVYSTAGEPVGFVFETTIYDIDGTPLGRIVGSRVHHFDGTYAGEWFKDMVVRHPQGRPRHDPAGAAPPRRRPPARDFLSPSRGCRLWLSGCLPLAAPRAATTLIWIKPPNKRRTLAPSARLDPGASRRG